LGLAIVNSVVRVGRIVKIVRVGRIVKIVKVVAPITVGLLIY
jgi:hypothetical protein